MNLRLHVDVAGNLPWAIRNAIALAIRIVTHPDRFPELTGRAFAPGVRLRARYRQRLEAIALVVMAMLRRTDLRTLRIGDERDDGLCSGVPIVKLEEATGLSRWRVSRAIADLEAAGYLASVQPVEAYVDLETQETCYRGFPACRTLSPLLFQRLGVTARKVDSARRRASERWRARHASPASARALLATRKAVRAQKRRQTHPEANQHAYNARMLALREEHPDWPAERIRAEARRLTG